MRSSSYEGSARRWLFPFWCCCIAILKLLFVSQNEILAIEDDSAAYAGQSLAAWSLRAPPGYPVWLHLCSFTGIPQRICIELLYLASSFFAAWVLKKCFGLATGFVTFVVLAWAPYTYFLFNHGWCDGFFTCLTLVGIGLSFLLLLSARRTEILGLAFALGLVFGVMGLTRNEDPLVALWIALIVMAMAWFWKGGDSAFTPWKFWRKPLETGLASVAGYCLVVYGVALSYYLTDGVFARGVAVMPQHIRLLRNLAKIDTGKEQVRFVPISLRSRELAYNVSPSFAKLRARIEDVSDIWHFASLGAGIAPGEIGAGWIWHAINSKVLPLNGGSPAGAERTYRQINREIEEAFHDGRLKKRFIVHPLIGGNVPGLMRQLPQSMSAVVSSAVIPLPDYVKDPGAQAELFDQAFLRRTFLTSNAGIITVQGWAFILNPGHKLLNVSVGSSLVTSAEIQNIDRPDVINGYNKEAGWKPSVIGFRASVKGRSPDDVTIRYLLDDRSQVETDHLKPMAVSTLENKTVPQDKILQGIDLVSAAENPNRPLAFLQTQAAVANFTTRPAFRWSALGIWVCFLITAVVTRVRGWGIFQGELLTIFMAFMAVSWCSRILFYSVLDAASWNANQIRYLAPAHAIGLLVLSVSVAGLFSFGAGKREAPQRKASIQHLEKQTALR